MRSSRVLALITFAAAVIVALLAGGTASAAAGKLTFVPQADTEVKAITPNTNYGSIGHLRVDGAGDPEVKSYLRFAVSGVSGTVKSAKVRLYAYTDTVDGPAIYLTNNDWVEKTVTWNNRPARIGHRVDDRGKIKENTWVDYDVTKLVQGNGTISFALQPFSRDGVYFDSREAPNKGPELVVTFDPKK
jgi:hypothetical protein